jgi:hypothetical protein
VTRNEFMALKLGDSVVVIGTSVYKGLIGKVTWLSGTLYPHSMAYCNVNIPEHGEERFHYWDIECSIPLKDSEIFALAKKPTIIGIDFGYTIDMSFVAINPNIAKYIELAKPHRLSIAFNPDDGKIIIKLINRPIIICRRIDYYTIEFRGDFMEKILIDMKLEMEAALAEVKSDVEYSHEDK